MRNPVVHFELNAPDGEALQKFYSSLFGWNVINMPEMGYALVDTRAGRGINGGIGTTENAYAMAYVEVADPQSALDRAESLGATIVMPVTTIPGAGVTLAQFRDHSRNVVGLVQATDQDGEQPRVAEGPNSPVGWFEIYVSDRVQAHAFYSELFGWKIDGAEYGEIDFEAGGRGIGGAIVESADRSPLTAFWAEAEDLEGVLARAEELGATRALEPMSILDHNLHIAAFTDPAGLFFGVFKATAG